MGGFKFLLKIPPGGGVSRRGRAEGAGGCLRQIGELGGGANFFFSGPKCPPRKGFSSMRTKEKKDNKKNWTNRCCTLVVARLSSSYF